LEDRRLSKLREDRLKAYATLARVTKMVEAPDPLQVRDLAEAHSEIELLTDEQPLRDAADRLVQASGQARQKAGQARKVGRNPYQTPEVKHAKETLDNCRSEFIQLAKEELQGQKQSPS
jgi:hypothetical protein